jgi:hypothetical protein
VKTLGLKELSGDDFLRLLHLPDLSMFLVPVLYENGGSLIYPAVIYSEKYGPLTTQLALSKMETTPLQNMG